MFIGDTILPFESPYPITFIAIIIASLILAVFLVNATKIEFLKESFISILQDYIVYVITCLVGLSVIIGYIFLLFFGANKYIGGGEPQHTRGYVVDFHMGRKSNSMEVEVPEFDRTISEGISNNHLYHIGSICWVEYHKGLFGLYVIDDVKRSIPIE